VGENRYLTIFFLVGDLCGFNLSTATHTARLQLNCDTPKNIVSEKKYRCNLRIEKGVFKPKSPRHLLLRCPPPLPPAAPSRPQPPPSTHLLLLLPQGESPQPPVVLAPSLRLSFVRTRRIADGGIAEHGDLPLSHR
jgi:hypothetical protein